MDQFTNEPIYQLNTSKNKGTNDKDNESNGVMAQWIHDSKSAGPCPMGQVFRALHGFHPSPRGGVYPSPNPSPGPPIAWPNRFRSFSTSHPRPLDHSKSSFFQSSCFAYHLWYQFWSHLGLILGLILGPKSIQKARADSTPFPMSLLDHV